VGVGPRAARPLLLERHAGTSEIDSGAEVVSKLLRTLRAAIAGAAVRRDCLAMQLDRPTMFHDPTRRPARYAVVVVADGSDRR
jgi:hypothetical protein